MIIGILAVAKSSSGLSHTKYCDVAQPDFQDHIGFTEEEVRLLYQREKNLKITMDDLRTNYSAYSIGNASLYNPFTVVCAINEDSIAWTWNASSLLPFCMDWPTCY